MDYQFDILRKDRKLILKIIEGYSIEQLNKIPDGFSNNIIWNIAHLVVTQQLLCYKLANQTMLVTDEMVEAYKKGTAPTKEVSKEEFEAIKKQFIALPEQMEKDYSDEIFKSYNVYTTSVDITLDSIDTAIAFNNFHEGIHLGVILAIRKFI